MTALRRVAACGFTLEQAVTVEAKRARAEEGTVQQVIRPVESLFENLRAVQVSPAQSVRFQNGGALFTARVPGCPKEDACRCRVYGPGPAFFGLGGRARPGRGLLTVFAAFSPGNKAGVRKEGSGFMRIYRDWGTRRGPFGRWRWAALMGCTGAHQGRYWTSTELPRTGTGGGHV